MLVDVIGHIVHCERVNERLYAIQIVQNVSTVEIRDGTVSIS